MDMIIHQGFFLLLYIPISVRPSYHAAFHLHGVDRDVNPWLTCH